MKANKIATRDALRILGFWFVREKAKQEPKLQHYDMSAYDAQVEVGKVTFWGIAGFVFMVITILIETISYPLYATSISGILLITTLILSLVSFALSIWKNDMMSPTTRSLYYEWRKHSEASRMVAHHLMTTLDEPGVDLRDKIKNAVTESLKIIAEGFQKAEAHGFTKPAKSLRDLFAKLDKFGQAVGAGKADWKMLEC